MTHWLFESLHEYVVNDSYDVLQIVTAMLLLGGSAVVNYLTGMNTIAACFLLPVGVVVYTLFGGIKATFMSDYA